MRFLFIVKFREPGGNGTKSFKTTAKSSKDAGKKLRRKGRIVSVRKVKKIM